MIANAIRSAALGHARVDARAEHRAGEAAGDEDRAGLRVEGAARRHGVGDGGDRGDRQDRHQRGARRGVAVEPGGPDQPGDDDDPAADAEQARQQPGRDADGGEPPVHARRRSPSSSSATRRSCGVVTLKFSAVDSTTRTVPPARSTSQASSVACGEHGVVDVERALERLAAERLRRLDRPQPRAVERRRDAAVLARPP